MGRRKSLVRTDSKNSSLRLLNRAISIRSSGKKDNASTSGGSRHGFSFSSFRGSVQPELSRKLYKLIKTENNLISSYEIAAKERVSIAAQLSDWGEQTGDEAISDISDKVGVLLSELGEQEDLYAHNLDDSRAILKVIRNTEKSVQPSRDSKQKILDEIAKLRHKEPESARLVTLEQELVRAEAENLVAEAQLTNITRQKLKEAYATEFAATIERAEKQIILARHGRRLLTLLDDRPLVPGDVRPPFEYANQARQILNDAEDDLREWQPGLQGVGSSSHRLRNDLMPSSASAGAVEGGNESGHATGGTEVAEGAHLAERNDAASHVTSGSATTAPTYAPSESEAGMATH